METYAEKTIKKFEWLSLKYHKMSLLFNELGHSLKIEMRNKSTKECKEILKNLNIDFEKVEEITKIFSELQLKDLKKNGN